MIKSELIDRVAAKQDQLSPRDVENVVKAIIDHMAEVLSQGRRIEIRGFGSFSLRYHLPRMGRNPRTGIRVPVPGRFFPHFKPGKELRERVNDAR